MLTPIEKHQKNPDEQDQFLSSSLSRPKVLLVEPSSTMRQVLQTHAEELGYQVDTLSSYAEAVTALKEQFDNFDDDYGCLLLGWPAVRDRDSTRFMSLLEGVDYHDLPVVVLSQDMRSDSRAWVAARNHCVMLKWKDYRSVGDLMETLLDQDIDDGPVAEVTPKFSNDDINILVVDDSASIRYALRDLLELHGYLVTTVGSFEEGRVIAQSQAFDIALLDYYLQDSTGDELCRVLLDEDKSGDLICAILTGSYSDHIIKRCLRAGAIECMFKNESSELLLARIDAISRVARQRTSLVKQRQQTDAIISQMGGSVFVFDKSGVITYCNATAVEMLGHGDELTLLGQSVSETVSAELLTAKRDVSNPGVFAVADKLPIDVTYKCTEYRINEDINGTIVTFNNREEAPNVVVQDKVQADVPAMVDAPVMANSLPSIANDPRSAFLQTLAEGHGKSRGSDELLTLLMLDIGYSDVNRLNQPIAESASAVEHLSEALKQIYRLENHVAYLGNSKFGVLLSHHTDAQAYHLTRKIMQLINEIGTRTKEGEFSCTGALLSLDKNRTLTEAELLQRTRVGLKLVGKRGRNNALLIDLKRLLPVYPDA